MKENVAFFGKLKSLIGIITEPSGEYNTTAVLFLNAGLLHRIGPNRLYVKMARNLADHGIISFRFDLSGIGDSKARIDNLPFEKSSIEEVQEAISYLMSVKNVTDIILIGLCSGADTAFRTSLIDNRITGMIGINGYYIKYDLRQQLREKIGNSVQERYYRTRIFDYRSWIRFLSGKSNFKVFKKIVKKKMMTIFKNDTSSDTPKSFTGSWHLLREKAIKSLIVFSEGSITLDFFRNVHIHEINKLKLNNDIKVEVINHVDHVFTLLWSQDFLNNIINQWIVNEYMKIDVIN
jgi:hypothetical protein